MKKWIIMGILGVLVIGIVFMSGCTTSPADKRMTGKYVYEKDPAQYIELNGDGTFYRLGTNGIGASGTYKIVNNTIRTCGQENCVEYTIDGNALVRMSMRYVNELVITVTTPPTSQRTGPAYSTGDIVKSPRVTIDTAWLITNYDASTDSYERTLIYPYADGSWGYRLNTNTEKISRTLMENVYTEKVANRALSSIPIRTP